MEIVVLILIAIVILTIYYFLKDLMTSILLTLTPIANFFNAKPITIFWILSISLLVLLILIRVLISRFKSKRITRNQLAYHPQKAKVRKNIKLCPWCHNALILKNGKYGKFWGCSSFPHCEYTEQINAEPAVINVGLPKTEKVSEEETKATYVKPEFKYQVKAALNPQEKEFLTKLHNVTKDSYYIRSQVAYSTLFEKKVTNLDEVTNRNDKTIIFSPELSYVADFVLYDKITDLPVATIEFNGLIHYEKETIEKDTKKRELCEKANLPYITFWTQNKDRTVTYSNTEKYIRERLFQFIPNYLL